MSGTHGHLLGTGGGGIDSADLFVERVVFTVDDEFDPTAYPGLRAVLARAQAGGAGSSGTQATTVAEQVHVGMSGAGGTYAESLIQAADLGTAPVPVTVGAGGVGAPASTAGNNQFAGVGDTSSFGAFVIAENAGFGAQTSAIFGPTTGVMLQPGLSNGVGASVGDLIIRGEPGEKGFAMGPDVLAPGAIAIFAGAGGSSHLGAAVAGGNAVSNSSGTDPGVVGQLYGGGASAPHSGLVGIAPAHMGQDGGDGVVIVDIYRLVTT